MAVGVTTAAVAFVAHALVPQMPWAAAIALGAIVAPAGRRGRHRRAALGQAAAPGDGHPAGREPAQRRLGAADLPDRRGRRRRRLQPGDRRPRLPAGGAGQRAPPPSSQPFCSGRSCASSRTRPTSIIFQFVTTFGVWILSERLGLSPILTIVIYAMLAARRSPGPMRAALRVPLLRRVGHHGLPAQRPGLRAGRAADRPDPRAARAGRAVELLRPSPGRCWPPSSWPG